MKNFPIAYRYYVVLWSSLILSISAGANDKFALVIGNGAYKQTTPLSNPENDATDVALALEKNGYEVDKVIDADGRSLARALADWQDKAAGAESGVFYYAGHGVEVDGENYLLPVDAIIESKGDLRVEAIALNEVLEVMSKASIRLKVVILDCCRDNPLPNRSWMSQRSSGGGLAEVDNDKMPNGTLLVFSGAPGKTVPDGSRRNSPFTEAFVKKLDVPGLAVTALFSKVAGEVKNGQEPWIVFDGSGRSFQAFSEYKITSGGPMPAGEMKESEVVNYVAVGRLEDHEGPIPADALFLDLDEVAKQLGTMDAVQIALNAYEEKVNGELEEQYLALQKKKSEPGEQIAPFEGRILLQGEIQRSQNVDADYEALKKAGEEKMSAERIRMIEVFRKKVNPITREIAKEKKSSWVFWKSISPGEHADGFDITDELLKRARVSGIDFTDVGTQ